MYAVWGLLSFLSLYVYVFCHISKKKQQLFLWVLFGSVLFLLFFLDSNYMSIKSFVTAPRVSEVFFFFCLFFSLLFILGYICFYIIPLTNSFLSFYSNVELIYWDFKILVIVLFSSKISIGFFFMSFVHKDTLFSHLLQA